MCVCFPGGCTLRTYVLAVSARGISRADAQFGRVPRRASRRPDMALRSLNVPIDRTKRGLVCWLPPPSLRGCLVACSLVGWFIFFAQLGQGGMITIFLLFFVFFCRLWWICLPWGMFDGGGAETHLLLVVSKGYLHSRHVGSTGKTLGEGRHS